MKKNRQAWRVLAAFCVVLLTGSLAPGETPTTNVPPSSAVVLIKAGTLQYQGDQPEYYTSSPHGKRGFCGTCGSRIVWQALTAEDDWLTNVTVGSLDNPAEARMTRHICADTRLPWYDLAPELPSLTSDQGDLLVEQLWAEVQHE